MKFATNRFDIAAEFPDFATRRKLISAAAPKVIDYARNLVKQLPVSNATRYDYESLLRRFIASSSIAGKPIDTVTHADLRAMIAELTKHGVRRRVKMALVWLRRIFDTAVADKLTSTNPMPRIPRLRSPKPQTDPFARSEKTAIVNAATGRNRSLITVLFETGCRPNELLAIEWSDVDWKRQTPLGKGVLRIARNLTRFGLGLPKTQESQRDVHLTPAARRALRDQRARSALRGLIVFPNERGGYMSLANFRRREWATILEKAKVPYRKVNLCRHTYAILMLEAGHSPRYVAGQLGHTSVEMVYRHYARWVRNVLPEDIEREV